MIDGVWDCSVTTPLGAQKSVLTFKRDGMTITGQGTAPSGESTALRNVTVEGDKVSWNVSVDKPMKLEVKMSVTVSGNAATGKAKFGLFGSGQISMAKR